MRLLVLPLLMLFSISLQAQSNFEGIYGNTESNTPIEVLQTIDGNYLALFRDRDPSTTQDTSFISLLKLDTDGDTLWAKSYQETGISYSTGMVEEANGTIAVSGFTDLGAQLYDNFLYRFDANGDSVAYTTYGTVNYELGEAMIHTADGGYAMYGRSGTGAFWDGSLLKVDSNGVQEWSKSHSLNTFDYGFALDQTYDGGYIVLGRTNVDGVTFFHDPYLVRTDAMGDTVWTQVFNTLGDDFVYAVKETADSGYMFLSSNNTVGDSALRVTKTDASGNLIGSSKPGPNVGDKGFDMHLTADGGAMIVGMTQSQELNSQIMLLKIDSVGQAEWDSSYGGSQAEVGARLNPTADGGWIVMGSTMDDGELDAYILKTDANGVTDCPAAADISFTADANTICPGTTVNFVSTTISSVTHSWLMNGSPFAYGREVSAHFLVSGTFDVTLRICADSSPTHTITVNDLRETLHVDFITQDSIQVATDTPATTVNTFSWDFGDGSAPNTTDLNAAHRYADTGFYTLSFTYTDVDGCGTTLSKVIHVIPSGTRDISALADQIKVWPNPMSQQASISLPKGNYQLTITDVIGQVIYEQPAEGIVQLNKANLKEGILFYRVSNDSETIKLGKLVVQ